MRKWIPLVIIAVAFAASAAIYPQLPERIPSHWNISGEVDDWSSRGWGAFTIPLMLVVGLALFHLLPRIDPRRANYAKFQGTFETLIITIMVFMAGVHLLILAAAMGQPVSIRRTMPAAVGLLLLVIGNLLPRMRPNWFIGVRTPWTLSSDRVWERTHRFAGRLVVAAGLITILMAIFIPRAAFVALICSAVVLSVSVVAYSYIIWKQDKAAQGESTREAASSP